MQLHNVLSTDRVAVGISASSKKTLLEKASELLSSASGAAGSRAIFESLCQRERLGSTGLGHGVAIPHGRVDAQPEVVGALVRLQQPIAFDAPDDEEVDLFFALVVPAECTDVHLKLLAAIAELFSDPAQRQALRQAESAEAVMGLLQASATE